MVWRKVILSFILICCILLVAASGSPANAAEEQAISEFEVLSSVPLNVVAYARSIVSNYLDMDYVLCCLGTDEGGSDYYLFFGEVKEENSGFRVIPELMYEIVVNVNGTETVAWGYPSQLGLDELFITNPNQFLLYSNVGSNISIYERGEIYAYVSLILLAIGVFCYLLRSIFNFVLRRN